MKKVTSYFAFLVTVVLALASCSSFIPVTGGTPSNNPIDNSFVADTDTPFVEQSEGDLVTSTEAPTEVPTVAPTETPFEPTITITTSPTMLAASPPPPKQTSNLEVDVSKLSKYKFEVRPNTDLTLSDISKDGKANACTISRSGFNLPVTIPVNAPSIIFQLGAGEYKLTCEIPNVSATISSK